MMLGGVPMSVISPQRIVAKDSGIRVSAGLRFAFAQMGAHRIRVAAAEDNSPSRHVIERLAFKREGIAREAEFVNGRWLSHVVYALLRTDPEALALLSNESADADELRK